jgi:hypothetical protein
MGEMRVSIPNERLHDMIGVDIGGESVISGGH